MTTVTQPLPHTLNITVDGANFEFFMSFALLNRICYLMGDSTQIPLILQDPELREAILVECLALRDPKGKVIQKRELDEVSVSFDDVANLLEFVTEHVTDFTVASMERANKVLGRSQSRIDALKKPSSSTPTQAGPESSVSKSPVV
jgi:hypothetical protein